MTSLCGLTEDAFLAALEALLPKGWAWRPDPASTRSRFLSGCATVLAVQHERTCILLNRESFPCLAEELLPDWERVLGLPDPCVPAAVALADRQAAVCEKLTRRGALSPAYYISVAARLGFEVTVEEYRPFRASQSAAGDALTNGPWVHTWTLRAPEETVRVFRASLGRAGEPLARWGNELLECVLSRINRAGKRLIFAYGE